MKKLCKRIITFSLVLCMVLSVFTGVVYAKDTDTIVILYENDVHCAVEGYSKLAAMKNELLAERWVQPFRSCHFRHLSSERNSIKRYTPKKVLI